MRPHLYQTPCAVAHCLNLILENIFKIPSLHKTFSKAMQINGFIYNLPGLLNMTRHYTKQRQLLRPAKTHFASAFVILHCIYCQKKNLRKMFTSNEWLNSKWTKEPMGKKCCNIRGLNFPKGHPSQNYSSPSTLNYKVSIHISLSKELANFMTQYYRRESSRVSSLKTGLQRMPYPKGVEFWHPLLREDTSEFSGI